MCGKVYFVVLILIVCVQVSISQVNPALEKCKGKLVEQISNIKLGRYPECFHATKLNDIKTHAAVIQDFYKTLSDNCRSPTSEDIQGCIEHFKEFMQSRSSDMQAGILGALHSFYEATRDCVTSFVDKVGNLDEWVLNGCEGKLENNS